MSTITKPLADGRTIEIIDTTGEFSRSTAKLAVAVIRDAEGTVEQVVWNDGTSTHPNA